MIEQRYEFYIDSEKYPGVYKKRTLAKNINPLYLPDNRKNDDIEKLMVCIEEYTIDSHNPFLAEFCLKNNITKNIYSKIFRETHELILAVYSLKFIYELPKDTILFSQDKKLSQDYYSEIKDYPHIIKFEDVEYFLDIFNQIINYKNNLILSKKILDYTQLTTEDTLLSDLRYRIYLNDRLLIERFFPIDLPLHSVLAEECYLSLTEPVKISIVTDHPLIFTKVISNKGTFYPNNKEFMLEP